MIVVDPYKMNALRPAASAVDSLDPTLEKTRLLLVGSDPALRHDLRVRLAHPRWSIREAHSGADALEKLFQEDSDVMLLEPRLPDLDLLEFQHIVRIQFPRVEVLTLDSNADHMPLTESSSRTAFALRDVLQGSRLPKRAETPLATLPFQALPFQQALVETRHGWQGMIGGSASMQRVYHAARLVARRDTTVLIEGESGTGKDLVARAIHSVSLREKQPFIVINCAAIPEPLLEAELFGYTKGSFTGATQSRIGRIHSAHGGTLFLDEIGDMPYPLQSKILRFLEQGEVQRIGGTDTLKVDCRVIAATNAALKSLVKKKQFREDLYYRLAVFPIQLSPLRERKEDLDALIELFLDRFCPGVRMHPSARELLLAHDWPGNVRELRNVMERASLFAESRPEIRPEDILL